MSSFVCENGSMPAAPAKNPDLHGNVPENSPVALLLVDVINDNFGRWQSDFRRLVEHVLHDGVPGEEVARILRPENDDYFVLKPKHSAFFETTLDNHEKHESTRKPDKYVSWFRAFRGIVMPMSIVVAVAVLVQSAAGGPFDHTYAAYRQLLGRYVKGARVDYQALTSERAALDAVAAGFDGPGAGGVASWSRPEQMAFWINAYNVFTLRAIVDHYPIRARWFSFGPRNSIRQIDGVWTRLKWRAAGREVTLDQIEHEILRPTFKDPRVHFAINCASTSCPPLAAAPYVAARLDVQLDEAARRYLASPQGLQIAGDRLRVSSIFKWYGDDFVERYAPAGPPAGPPRDRAVRGAIARFGPRDAAELATSGRGRLEFLDYDWSLNDAGPPAR